MGPERVLRIGILEDDDELRAAFAGLVDDAGDMACAATFGTAEDALASLKATAPDVMLVDINLPGMDGIEFVRKLRATKGAPQVVMLTTFEDANLVFESLKAGANGYLLKRAALSELCEAIREVARGGAPMTSPIARKVVQFFNQ